MDECAFNHLQYGCCVQLRIIDRVGTSQWPRVDTAASGSRERVHCLVNCCQTLITKMCTETRVESAAAPRVPPVYECVLFRCSCTLNCVSHTRKTNKLVHRQSMVFYYLLERCTLPLHRDASKTGPRQLQNNTAPPSLGLAAIQKKQHALDPHQSLIHFVSGACCMPHISLSFPRRTRPLIRISGARG